MDLDIDENIQKVIKGTIQIFNPSGMRIFRKKSRNSCFFGQNLCIFVLFMMFWAFLTTFPAFLLKVILMPDPFLIVKFECLDQL